MITIESYSPTSSPVTSSSSSSSGLSNYEIAGIAISGALGCAIILGLIYYYTAITIAKKEEEYVELGGNSVRGKKNSSKSEIVSQNEVTKNPFNESFA